MKFDEATLNLMYATRGGKQWRVTNLVYHVRLSLFFYLKILSLGFLGEAKSGSVWDGFCVWLFKTSSSNWMKQFNSNATS